jgi:nitrite reductase/ring-hydroxylating ferredoxin subunit
MKQTAIVLMLGLFILSCSSSDDNRNSNPNLFDPLVNLNLNLNLPEYNPLKFPGSSVFITSQGIKGIVIYNVNNEIYTASELTDPNHVPNDCSSMSIVGIIATCPCPNDNHEYDIVTGKHRTDESLYPMQQYRIERNGDNIFVSN